MRQKTGLSRDDECKISKNSGRKWVRRTTRGALPVEHLGWDARVIDLSGQRVAQEIALEGEQVFGHGLVIGHMGDARQRQEGVRATRRHQGLREA